MDNKNNYQLDPSDYLASINLDASSAPGNKKRRINGSSILIAGLVGAIIVAISITTFGILGLINTTNNNAEVANDTGNGSSNTDYLPGLGRDYQALDEYSDDVVVARRLSDNRIVFLNTAKDLIAELDQDKYALMSYEFHDGRLPVHCTNDDNRDKFGFIDKQGNLVIECRYSVVSDFKNGEANFWIVERLDETADGVDIYRFEQGKIDTNGGIIESSESFSRKLPERE